VGPLRSKGGGGRKGEGRKGWKRKEKGRETIQIAA